MANREGDGVACLERQPSCREASLRDLFRIGLKSDVMKAKTLHEKPGMARS
jgi:hypothetical protein